MAFKRRQRHGAATRSTLRRAGRPVPERQDDASRSDPGAHRGDPAPGHGRNRNDRRRRQQGSAPPSHERRTDGRRPPVSWATPIRFSTAPARSSSFTTCARCFRRSTSPSSFAKWTRRKSRSFSSSCASSKTGKFRASCSSTRSTRPMPASTTCLKLLQPASRTKLIMRQIPTFSGDIIIGLCRSRAGARLCLQGACSPPKSSRSKAIPPIWKRPRGSRCWKRSPTTTTS